MKKLAKTLTVIGLLLSIPLSAQIRIGGYSLASPSAPLLRASIGAAGYTSGFLAEVGGVAFDHKALPADGFKPHSVVLKYIAGNLDGQRVVAIIDGQPVRLNLYDWQLMPIVRFAQSSDTAVFTLFGQLDDAKQEAGIRDNDGHVVNYHAAFVDTLMGLRMLQLDTLLAGSANDDLAVDLPKDGARYILGSGERLPDVTQNRAALATFHTALKAALDDKSADFRSYVIGDAGRDIRFSVDQGNLRIFGEPGYYFWSYNGDDPAVQARILSQVQTAIRLAKATAKRQAGDAFDEQAWLIGQLSQLSPGALSAKQKQELRRMPAGELTELLEDLRAEKTLAQPAYEKVVSRTEMASFVNSHIDLVRKINPNVWAAATTVMRYAAFFRYCSGNAPADWRLFAQRVGGIRVQPAVTTPTVLQLASARPGGRSAGQ